VAGFTVKDDSIITRFPGKETKTTQINHREQVIEELNGFVNSFTIENESPVINGVFGYATFDSIEYFEDIKLKSPIERKKEIPSIQYFVYKYIIAINHFQNTLYLVENIFDNQEDGLDRIENMLHNRNIATYPFNPVEKEESNITDKEYMEMVSRGKDHCKRGDVFQIVLSRQFNQRFTGDEFNVYRTLRSINPSPYLFYFDYGNYKIFGSSPEVQLEIKEGKAIIHPIAGTFKRTGNDEEDKKLAEKLMKDKKENSEHVMLVDLARNDLSRNASNVTVETYREVQYFSHVLHMVSVVSGKIPAEYNPVQVMADTFPAGTLSGAPKYKAMELIDKYEKNRRGYYGGCIGYIGFNGDFNHAILIRSFLSKDNNLFYQAGAGIVVESNEENELNEVNNKLAALKSAIEQAKTI
jgi:anthranilate synthase component 1